MAENTLFTATQEDQFEDIIKEYKDIDIVAKEFGKRLLMMFILDTSYSMKNGGKMEALNEGIRAFAEYLKSDDVAVDMVDIGVVKMGGAHAECVTLPQSVQCYEDVNYEAAGVTPMKEAFEETKKQLMARTEMYDREAINYYKPIVVMITDGVPTDSEGNATIAEADVEEIHDLSRDCDSLVYTFYVGDDQCYPTAKKVLERVATKDPKSNNILSYKLEGNKDKIKELMIFLSKSAVVASKQDKNNSNNNMQTTVSLFN